MPNLTHTGAQLDDAISKVFSGYKDTTGTNALASDILQGKKAVTTAGLVTGTHTCPTTDTTDANALASDILSGKTAYVKGSKVTGTLQTQSKTATPTTSSVVVNPDNGSLLSSVTINPIPSSFKDTADANALASEIANGKSAYVKGVKITGSMAIAHDNTTVRLRSPQDKVNTGYDTGIIIPAGYTPGFTVEVLG